MLVHILKESSNAYSKQFTKNALVNVIKFRTLKNIIFFSAVRNFRNNVCEKMLVFEILECRLYHEKKWYICMSKCGRNVLKHGDMILCYLLFFSFH